METLWEMAKDLGRDLQQDERFIRMQMAQAAADEDKELQALIGEFNLKRMAINTETAKDDKDDEKLKQLNTEIREIYAKVMANPSMDAYNTAKTAFDQLFNGISAILNMAAQGLDPEDYDEHAGCTGDCGSCGGCH